MFGLTSMQDSTDSFHYPELVGEPLRLELNFTFPPENVTELLVLGNESLLLQSTSLELFEKNS